MKIIPESETQPSPSFREIGLKLQQQNEQVADELIDLFRFKCLCILVCRGKDVQKAEAFLSLLKYTNSKMQCPERIQEKITITWDNQRLRKVIWHFVYYSEILPKVWFNRREIDSYKTMY